MKKVLIIFQLRNRDNDNNLLLKAELERRGYVVDIVSDVEKILILKRYDLYFLPSLYNNKQYDELYYRYNIFDRPAINMRCEQVGTRLEWECGSMCPREKAINVMAATWGEKDKAYCEKHGMDMNDVSITGHIGIDFLRNEFKPFWMSRGEISKKYGLDSNCKWFLFVSSMAYADDEELQKKGISFFGKYADDYQKLFELHGRTRKIVFQYFKKFLGDNSDTIIIYRPHPAENINFIEVDDSLRNYAERFRIIGDYNIKQWLLTVDVACFWWSTGLAEAFFAKTNCFILRPEELSFPDGYDLIEYENGKWVTNYDDFRRAIERSEKSWDTKNFPVEEDVIRDFYDVTEIPSYVRMADLADSQIGRKYNVGSEFIWRLKQFKYFFRTNLVVKHILKGIYKVLYKKFGWKINIQAIRRKYAIGYLEDYVDNRHKRYKEDGRKYAVLQKIIEKGS